MEVLQVLLRRVGSRGWIYEEGGRGIWTIETTFHPPEPRQQETARIHEAYIRGYFDAEGGMPRDVSARFYIQLTQKDRTDLARLRRRFVGLGISCGRIHNPSVRVDPDYFRFYVLSESHAVFMQYIKSWHPLKRALISERLRKAPAPGG
jgi:hypothetical protein